MTDVKRGRRKNIPNAQPPKAGVPTIKTGLLIPAELREQFDARCISEGVSMTAKTIELWSAWLGEKGGNDGNA